MECLETILKRINVVTGVSGAFVCTAEGKVAAKALPDGFDATSLETAARVATQTLSALETSGQRIVELDLVYGQGRLVLKNLRGGALVIICARNVNIPLLNLTANAVAKKLSAELKPNKPAVPTSAPPAASSPASPEVAAEVVSTPPLEVASGRSVPSSELVDDKFFDELTRELAQVMGPISSIIIEDEVDALKGKREAFPKARAPELVERISLAIHDETERAKFQQVMSEAIRTL